MQNKPWNVPKQVQKGFTTKNIFFNKVWDFDLDLSQSHMCNTCSFWNVSGADGRSCGTGQCHWSGFHQWKSNWLYFAFPTSLCFVLYGLCLPGKFTSSKASKGKNKGNLIEMSKIPVKSSTWRQMASSLSLTDVFLHLELAIWRQDRSCGSKFLRKTSEFLTLKSLCVKFYQQ